MGPTLGYLAVLPCSCASASFSVESKPGCLTKCFEGAFPNTSVEDLQQVTSGETFERQEAPRQALYTDHSVCHWQPGCIHSYHSVNHTAHSPSHNKNPGSCASTEGRIMKEAAARSAVEQLMPATMPNA